MDFGLKKGLVIKSIEHRPNRSSPEHEQTKVSSKTSDRGNRKDFARKPRRLAYSFLTQSSDHCQSVRVNDQIRYPIKCRTVQTQPNKKIHPIPCLTIPNFSPLSETDKCCYSFTVSTKNSSNDSIFCLSNLGPPRPFKDSSRSETNQPD